MEFDYTKYKNSSFRILSEVNRRLKNPKEDFSTWPQNDIRGHHFAISIGCYLLEIINQYQYNNIIPTSYADLDDFVKEESQKNYYDMKIEEISKRKNLSGYKTDTVGQSEQEMETYLLGNLEQSFLISCTSKEEIVIGVQPDHLCSSCAIGKHCQQDQEDNIWIRKLSFLNRHSKIDANSITFDTQTLREITFDLALGILVQKHVDFKNNFVLDRNTDLSELEYYDNTHAYLAKILEGYKTKDMHLILGLHGLVWSSHIQFNYFYLLELADKLKK